jgi:two-component system, chemotaxis family, response regulator WspR
MDTNNRKRFKILIIDDDPDLLAHINTMLTNEGYANIMCARSGIEALAALQIDPETLQIKVPLATAEFDLILLDYSLPDVNGNALCESIKSLNLYWETPIVILTGNDDLEILKEAFDHGASDFIRKPIHRLELIARVHAALRIKQKTQQLRIANEILKDLYTSDPLTNLSNRGSFDQHLTLEWQKHVENKIWLSLIMIDVDYFKAFNDTYGHQAGDNCLIRIAETISNSLHRPTDFVARYGGEEFVVLLPQTDAGGAVEVAEKIRKAVSKVNIKRGPDEHVTISCGVATSMQNSKSSAEELLKAADLALYAAKKSGRNKVVHFAAIQK